MKRKFYRLFVFPCLVIGGLALVTTGCQQPSDPSGRTYNYQCIWNGVTDFAPYGEFKAGGVLVHHDDTATINGTWSNVEETVIWQLNNPPKNTKFRGTFDSKAISGNISDDQGRTGIFQGARR